ncbi:28556_t:CDS:2, partial [Racocetra persica]
VCISTPACSISASGTEAVIEKLVKAVNKMTIQLQEKKKSPREYSKEYLAKAICFKCGSDTTLVNNKTLQALLSLLDNKKEEESREQMNYLNIREDNWNLFMPAKRYERKKPTASMPFKKCRKDPVNSKGSGELQEHKDELVPEDISMDKDNLKEL